MHACPADQERSARRSPRQRQTFGSRRVYPSLRHFPHLFPHALVPPLRILENAVTIAPGRARACHTTGGAASEYFPTMKAGRGDATEMLRASARDRESWRHSKSANVRLGGVGIFRWWRATIVAPMLAAPSLRIARSTGNRMRALSSTAVLADARPSWQPQASSWLRQLQLHDFEAVLLAACHIAAEQNSPLSRPSVTLSCAHVRARRRLVSQDRRCSGRVRHAARYRQ
jgi:hypothetical protein